MTNWIQPIAQLAEQRRDYVVVTLVETRGSAPQVVGSKMIVTKEGLKWGTVGGGKIEAHCIHHSQDLLQTSGESHLATWNLQKDIGMSCGGEVRLFFDCHVHASWTISIFGAGHVAQELCRVLQTWSCRLQVFDTRAEWLDKLPLSPNLEKKLSLEMSQEVQTLPKGTYLLLMTQGHATDLPILSEALRMVDHFAFVGLIGSGVKAEKIRRELKETGIPDLAIERLVCPVGLPIGDNTPPEISISIAAQILTLRTDAKSIRLEETK